VPIVEYDPNQLKVAIELLDRWQSDERIVKGSGQLIEDTRDFIYRFFNSFDSDPFTTQKDPK
jgi:hypothetical protein